MDRELGVGDYLAVLASRAAQERYMLNAGDEYLLPSEAIENAWTVIAALWDPRSYLKLRDSRTRAAVAKFSVTWKEEERHIESMLTLPWNELVLANSSWAALRAAAHMCIIEIGFDLARWEQEEL